MGAELNPTGAATDPRRINPTPKPGRAAGALQTDRAFLTHAEIDDSQNSTVPNALHHCDLAKILVQGHDNPRLPPCVGKDFFVPRVLRPFDYWPVHSTW